MSEVGSSRPQGALRFVVLHHTGYGEVHYDLMLESGEKLSTWRCSGPPESAGASGLPCRRIGDHRSAYLDYEGPVSGGRGRVTRHDSGHYAWGSADEARLDVRFEGVRLRGTYRLERAEGSDWTLRAVGG